MSGLRLSIGLRLTLVFLAATTLAVTIGSVFLVARISQVQDRATERDLLRRWDELADDEEEGRSVATGGARLLAAQIARRGDGPTQVFAPDGSLLASVGVSSSEPLLTRRQARSGRPHGALRRSEHGGRRWETWAGPLTEGGPVVAVASDLDGERDARDALARDVLLVAGALVLLTGGAAYLIARRALAPVETMRARAAEIALGARPELLPEPDRDDEIARLARTLNRLLAELHRSVERERRFVADAGHELRTPIALLLAEIELALERPRSPEAHVEVLHTLDREVHRLARLAEQLLALGAHAPARATAVVDVAILARAAVDRAVRAAPAPADGTASEGAVTVHALGDARAAVDAEQVERALTNLVDNALVHGRTPVRVDVVRATDRVVVRVTDAGPGFPADLVDRATERFARAPEARASRGAGLGLAIVESIARDNGGVVRIRPATAVGSSSCVELDLPAAAAAGSGDGEHDQDDHAEYHAVDDEGRQPM